MVGASKATKGPRLALHGGGRAEHRAARRRPFGLDLCGLSGLVGGTIRPGRDDGPRGRVAPDAPGLGASLERGAHRSVAAADETACLASGHRLAPGAVLWSAAPEPQRTVLRQAPPGDEAVSRLRLGLHCGLRPTLHAGALLGSPPRIEGH